MLGLAVPAPPDVRGCGAKSQAGGEAGGGEPPRRGGGSAGISPLFHIFLNLERRF